MFVDIASVRPSKLQSPGAKDDVYHLQMAKSYLTSVSMSLHQEFVTRSMINWAFYKGNQWMFYEDLENFMMDETGGFRNRIKIVQNVIRPVIEYYRGNTIRMDFTPRARCISRQAITRRESQLAEALTMSNFVNRLPKAFKGKFKEKYDIGDTQVEVEQKFINKYVDEFEEKINYIIDKIASDNDIDDLKNRLIPYVALNGMGVLKEDEWAGKQIWDIQEPDYFIFDHSAKRPDLKDSEYMGNWEAMLPVEIFERYPNLSYNEKRVIEDASRNGYAYRQSYNQFVHNMFSFAYNGSRQPVYNMYWADGYYSEYAFVTDEVGEVVFKKINDKEYNTGYTDADIVDPPNDELLASVVKSKSWNKSKMKAKIYTDCLRYCSFIPAECIGASPDTNRDIVLAYGKYPYSNKEGYGADNISFPFKVYCWLYDKGEVYSPIDSLIDPQRLLNRMISVGEAQINNSRGSGTIYDKDTVDSQDGEEDIERRMNMSQPIGVNAKGNLNNSISSYDSTIKAGTFSLFKVANEMERISQSMIGGGESLMGSGGSVRATGSVQEMNLNQGTIMQEPVFYCVNKTLLQAYESMASRGRRILIANHSELVVTTGDYGAKVISLSSDMELEDVRMYLERAQSKGQQSQEANEMLFILLNYGLLDGEKVSLLFNNSTPLQVGKAMREFQNEIREARMLAEQNKVKEQAKGVRGLMAAQDLEDTNTDVQNAVKLESQRMKSEEGIQKAYLNLAAKTRSKNS